MESWRRGVGDIPAEPRRAADCLQRPLRSRFRQRLRPSVAMTANVKSELPIFGHVLHPVSSASGCTASVGRVGARKTRQLSLRLSVGWLPPSLAPSGACFGLGARVVNLLRLTRGPPYRGCPSSDGLLKPWQGVVEGQDGSVSRALEEPAGPWPTETRSALGQSHPRPDADVCLVR